MEWGRLLHDAAMPVAHTANVMNAWARIDGHAGRRFSVHVDAALEAGSPEADVKAAREAATLLLGLPWELLHDGDGFLFQGAKPTSRPPAAAEHARCSTSRWSPRPSASCSSPRGRRTIRAVTSTTGRARCRWSRRWKSLPGLVQASTSSARPRCPPCARSSTAPACAREPYHVVHFDGHGVYDRTVGLGGLCFEDPQDTAKLDQPSARHRLHRASSARCCATTASRSSSSKPARPRRPSRRPSPSPASC